MKTTIRFSTYPRTEPPPHFVDKLVNVFYTHEAEISTEARQKGLISNEVLQVLSPDLANLEFEMEKGKGKGEKLNRPVFYGENGIPTMRYEIDAYNPQWKCALEIEAGRGWMGNAVYRDLIQASVMVGVDFLCLALANYYRYRSSGKAAISRDYENARALAEAIYGHTRLRLPYNLILIGY